MSSVAQGMLGWVIAAALAVVLWGIMSIIGWLLLGALKRLGSNGLRETALALLSFSPFRATAIDSFLDRIAQAHERVFGGTSVRVIMTRQHKMLDARLVAIRADLNERLLKLAAASSGEGAPNLITLLQSFKGDVKQAEQFGEIEDGLVDRTVERNQARARLLWASLGSLLIGGFNAMLLYIFFREFEVGVMIPWIELDAIVMAPLLLPAAEFIAGFFTEYMRDGEQRTVGAEVVKWVVVSALAAMEYFVFFLLFKNIFDNAELSQYASLAVPVLSFVGPGLTLLQAQLGAGAGRAMRVQGQLGSEEGIKEQIEQANRFVAGLPARFDGIGAAARGAMQAVSQLATDLRQRDEAELPIVSAVDEQRRLFLDAIDKAGPAGWAQSVEGNAQDAQDVGRYAWLLPIPALLLGWMFIVLVHGFMEQTQLFGSQANVARWAAALGAAGTCFIGGSFVFRRIGLAAQSGGEVRDALFPRDDLMRYVALGIVTLLLCGVMAAGITADGGYGAIEGLFAVGAGAGLLLLGSYPDLIAKGISFLAMAVGLGLAMLAEAVAGAIVTLGMALLALLYALLYCAAFILGWPLIRLLERFGIGNDAVGASASGQTS